MKRFDSESVKARLIDRLRLSEDWALMLADGTISNLLDSISEGENELARYMEFLYLEKKWKTAQNFSSLEAQGDLLSYKRQLPQSAIGTVIVSHTDVDGQNRLANYGRYFFDINAISDYDDLSKDPNGTLEEKKSLVPWTNSTPYTIPKGTRFIASNGTEFVSTQAVTSKALLKPWSQISGNEQEKDTFFKSGGWNGIKYLKVPVIQGIVKRTSLGITSSRRFESFVLNSVEVDAAVNSISQDYFKVHLVDPRTNTDEVWVEIDSIKRANAYDKVFEKSILKDGRGIKLKFGDGISGKLPPNGFTVEIEYLETKGAAGNIDSKYSIQTMVFPKGYTQVDPRTNTNTTFLACTNISAIQGGRDIEQLSEFKVNAPKSYLKSYTTATVDKYVEMIKKYSPLNLLHVKVYPKKDITAFQVNSGVENWKDRVFNYVDVVSNNLNLTTVLSNGEVIDENEAEEALLQPLMLSLNGQISQNDTFTYVKPNLIEICPSVKVRSSDLSISETEIYELVKTAFAMEYDIYNQEFQEPLYYSKLVELAKLFPFSDSVSILNEAVATVDYEHAYIEEFGASTKDYLIKIPFYFDKFFNSSQVLKGFKDCTVNSDYLLKCDLKFINSGSDGSNDRTFFLYDNRIDESGKTSIDEAKSLNMDGSTIPFDSILKSKFFKEYKDGFDSRQVRVAQFPFISRITDNKLMSAAKKPSTSPYEIRPYVQDTSKGVNKTFTSSMVESTLQRATEPDGAIGSICFKANSDWIDYVDITFEQNTLDDRNSGSGEFIIPFKYLGLKNVNLALQETNKEIFQEVLTSNLNQYISLRIYAQPKMVDFEPYKENDIIYLNEDYIKVEKDTKAI